MSKKTTAAVSAALEKYTLVCGLEIHAELKTQSKMFCGCKNDPFGAAAPNTHTCPVCLGMPGGLPVANQLAIENLIKLGLMLGCKINQFSKFDRKNYFYPDLAKGYQISQYDLPFCYEGQVETSEGPVRLTRIHLEEDTAKLQHAQLDGQKVSLIDFNRSGVPLAEIVSEPDIKTASQAAEYGRQLREVMRYLGIADCDMEKGGMRLEANISLQTAAQKQAGQLPAYKVEVKNINSFNFMEQAIAYEIERQAEILDRGELPAQETRGYSPETKRTFSQRLKEDAADYRYFPDPDLPPIEISDQLLVKWQQELPESKTSVIKRWEKDFAIEARYAQELTENLELVAWTQDLLASATQKQQPPNKVLNFLINKKINARPGLTDVDEVIAQFQALNQVDQVDQGDLITIIQQVLTDNPDAIAKYQAGQKQVIGFFMGQIMRAAAGKKLDAGMVNQLLLEQLK